MTKRSEINDFELDSVVGGSLIWSKGGVYCKEDPETTYGFYSYSACREWIQNNWSGKPQDNDCLRALEDAGLIYEK